MDSALTILAQELAEQRIRARRAEEQMRELNEMLASLGLSIWQTDRRLRLRSAFGMDIAESYLDSFIGDFYRDAYGLSGPDTEPLAAHYAAQGGQSVTLNLQHQGRQYAILVEPKRDHRGEIVGTIGMSVRLPAE